MYPSSVYYVKYWHEYSLSNDTPILKIAKPLLSKRRLVSVSKQRSREERQWEADCIVHEGDTEQDVWVSGGKGEVYC